VQPTLSSPHDRLCASSSAHMKIIITLVVVVVVVVVFVVVTMIMIMIIIHHHHCPCSPFTHQQHSDLQHASKSSRGLKVSDASEKGTPYTTYDGWLHFSYPNNVANKAISRRHALIKVFPVTVRITHLPTRRKQISHSLVIVTIEMPNMSVNPVSRADALCLAVSHDGVGNGGAVDDTGHPACAGA
jgi:hypothetical protein